MITDKVDDVFKRMTALTETERAELLRLIGTEEKKVEDELWKASDLDPTWGAAESDTVFEDEDYASLHKILKRAFNQAVSGKGKERHADGRVFEEQPIIRIQELVGSGFCLGQAIKKIQESVRLETPKSSTELLGAIVYLAAAVFFQEREYTKEG